MRGKGRWGWLWVLFLVSTALGLRGVHVHAAAPAKSVTVTRRDGHITIHTDGTVRVEETWEVIFHGGPFTHAFRDIPLNRVEDITDWAVSEPGQPYTQASTPGSPHTFVVERASDTVKVSWYFPSTTDATRTFTLAYTLHGALWIAPEGDQFFWKFIEADRGYPIESSRVEVVLPGQWPETQLRTASYLNGEEGPPAMFEDGRVVFQGGPFAGGTEWEIRVQWPHGVVQAEPPAWQTREAMKPYLILGGSVLVVVGGLILVGLGIGLWYKAGRDPATVAVPQVTHPPTDDPPGVVGVLIDERADRKDTVATLLDLARRGHVRFTTGQGVTLPIVGEVGGGVALERTPQPEDPLRPYEQRFLDGLFREGDVMVSMSQLRSRLPLAHSRLQGDLYAEVARLGYFPARPDRVRTLYTLLAAVLLLGYELAVVGFSWWAFGFHGSVFPILICLGSPSLLLATWWGGIMPRKTRKGARAAALWKGFQRYLLRLHDMREMNPERAAEIFESYLPYATALGVEDAWVRRFAAMEHVPAPTWWGPMPSRPAGRPMPGRIPGGLGRPMTASPRTPGLDTMAGSTFSSLSSISDTLLDALNTVARSTSSSSSGGGGFSGGGGGGGGGGGSSGFG